MLPRVIRSPFCVFALGAQSQGCAIAASAGDAVTAQAELAAR